MKWLDEILPDTEQFNKFSKSLAALTSAFKDSIEIGIFDFYSNFLSVYTLLFFQIHVFGN